jgi:hypothetical protein
MSTRTSFFFGTFAAVVVAAIALVAPSTADARTCDSMGSNWFNSNQGAQCDASCSEACIVKWDCDGEACEPHHCWKCAAGSPPPPPPTPPPADPVRDADGVRCDAMGEGWYFSNQGNFCNENCSEACIPKWDCGGQPCRPHHCWKCAAGTPPQPPVPADPSDPGGPGRVKLPNGLVETSYHVDETHLHVKVYVEALNSLETVGVDMSYRKDDGSVTVSNSGEDVHKVSVTLSIPLDQIPHEVQGAVPGPDGWMEWVVNIGRKVYGFAKKHGKIVPFRTNACYTFDKWENNACLYKSPLKCGDGACIKDTVRIEGRTDASACSPKAQVERLGFRVKFLGFTIHTQCIPGAVPLDAPASCNACSITPTTPTTPGAPPGVPTPPTLPGGGGPQ